MVFKVIVAGSRSFDDYELMKKKLDYFFRDQKDVAILSGTARGADRLGERYARERGLPVERFPADWDLFGKSAGYHRNQKMAKYADACVCFWDGASRGTEMMIKIARERKLPLRIVTF